jgi:hypothetical protein
LNSQGLFFSQHHTLGVLIIVLISSFGKSKIFRLEAMQSSSLGRGVISIVIAQSLARPTTDRKVGSSTRSLVKTIFFFWIFIFFELFFKGFKGFMGCGWLLKDVWSAWRP